MSSSDAGPATAMTSSRLEISDRGRVRRGYQVALVALLSLTFGIVFFDRNALGFLMPFVQPDLGLSNTQIGLLASALAANWAVSGVLVFHLSNVLPARTGSRRQ